ncbi:MAG: EamA family transporter [Flavipsychrobacter sp.]|nr:EamA family transporter [Flavipsychrobacter sp.]
MHYPAFLFAGVRQAIAGIILMGVALSVNKQKDLSSKNLLRQMLVGFLMLSLGNGMVSWGEKFIPSGIAALLCAMMPLFAVLFNLLASKKDHFNLTIGIGLLLGVCGVALIFRHNIAEMTQPAYLGGIAATLFATVSWAFGSTVNKKHIAPVNPFLNSGMQLFFGGIFMLIMSPAIDNYQGMELWNRDGILALVYLIIFGSALAYAAYMYTLSVLPIGIATLYAYVNPLIAVIAGYLFMKEDLNIYTGLAFATIAISVYLVNRGYRQQHKETTKEEVPETAAFPESAAVE